MKPLATLLLGLLLIVGCQQPITRGWVRGHDYHPPYTTTQWRNVCYGYDEHGNCDFSIPESYTVYHAAVWLIYVDGCLEPDPSGGPKCDLRRWITVTEETYNEYPDGTFITFPH